MGRTLIAVFDGEVLRPVEKVDLQRNVRYQVTVEEIVPEDHAPGMTRAFEEILVMATDLGVPDLAEQHDHYLYGTPKR